MNNMKPLEKIELVGKIAVLLQEKMNYSTIESYLTAYGIDCRDFEPSTNSKRVYVEELLRYVGDDIVLKIAEELEITQDSYSLHSENINFWKQGYLKLFISHLAKHKDKAKYLQEVLAVYGISAFVAHEDIEASKEWQNEIEKALHTMEAMTVILTEDIIKSEWCDQEIGFAVGKSTFIIPIQYGIVPYGFIGKYQAIQGQGKTVGGVALSIYNAIIVNQKTRDKMLNILTVLISISTKIDLAEKRLKILSKANNIPEDILTAMAERIRENIILTKSDIFMKELKELLQKHNIDITILNSKESWKIFIDEDKIPF